MKYLPHIVLSSILIITLLSYPYKQADLKHTYITPPIAISTAQSITIPVNYVKTIEEAFTAPVGIFKIPLATVSTSPSATTISVPKREYSIQQTIVENPDRSLTPSTKLSIKVDDKVYNIPTNNTTTTILPDRRFRFNPIIFLSASTGINTTINPDVFIGPSISLFSYGRYIQNPEYSILNIGMNYNLNKDATVSIAPILFNLNPAFPFLRNTYVAPEFYYNIVGKSYGVGISLKVSL